MLRNRYNPTKMGYDPGFAPPIAPVSKLDPKDERLIEQSEEIGFLKGQNDLLNEDNRRLEEDNASLRSELKEARERNTELERRDSAASAGYKSGQQLVDEIESALKAKKESK